MLDTLVLRYNLYPFSNKLLSQAIRLLVQVGLIMTNISARYTKPAVPRQITYNLAKRGLKKPLSSLSKVLAKDITNLQTYLLSLSFLTLYVFYVHLHVIYIYITM